MAQAQTQAAGAAATSAEAGGLLDQILSTTKARDTKERDRNKELIEEFVKNAVKPGAKVGRDVEDTIKKWISALDEKLSDQVSEIMHAPEFQRLEGTWRGLHYLVHQSETGTTLKINVMNISKRELFRDLDRAVEFDQSTIFKRVYEDGYGLIGANPYGLLVGDYYFDRTSEDIELLKKMAGVAAAAHAPFVAGVDPGMFNMSSWTELNQPRDLAKIFDTEEYAAWKSFRESEDSRYVGLTMPRVLARNAYGSKFTKVAEFNFEERLDGSDHDRYCWMNASWAYAARITDAFAKWGWLARTRGVEGGGKVEGLPVHTYWDGSEVKMKCPTEVLIPDRREFELSNLGFLPLLNIKGTDQAVFMGAQSCQKPKTYFDPAANANAELSAKFNYILNISRFAHYLKVMARDKIGSHMTAKECEIWLNEWIQNYVTPDPNMVSDEIKAQKPLAEARIDVQEVKGKPGYYQAVAYLKPHFQLEALSASMRLVAEVPKKKG